MKFLASILVFGSLLWGSSTAFAVSERMSAELDKYESFMTNSRAHYKVEERFESASILFLKAWPVEVQRSIYTKLWNEEQPPLVVDPSDLTSYRRGQDLEYVQQGYIIRSVVVNVDGEKVYVAIYNVNAGTWGRQREFLEYYILDSAGELLRGGMSRD